MTRALDRERAQIAPLQQGAAGGRTAWGRLPLTWSGGCGRVELGRCRAIAGAQRNERGRCRFTYVDPVLLCGAVGDAGKRRGICGIQSGASPGK